jgi:hypothetical protein
MYKIKKNCLPTYPLLISHGYVAEQLLCVSVFSIDFEIRWVDLPFFLCAEKKMGFLKKIYSLTDFFIFMAYGVILKHLEVDKITGAFSAGKRGRVPFFARLDQVSYYYGAVSVIRRLRPLAAHVS